MAQIEEVDEPMSNLYDEQFKRRVETHLLVCDPVSADIISKLMWYIEHPEHRDVVAKVQANLDQHIERLERGDTNVKDLPFSGRTYTTRERMEPVSEYERRTR